MSSFLSIPETEPKEADALKSQLSGSAIDWPSTDDQSLNEFSIPYLATIAFPTLFLMAKEILQILRWSDMSLFQKKLSI